MPLLRRALLTAAGPQAKHRVRLAEEFEAAAAPAERLPAIRKYRRVAVLVPLAPSAEGAADPSFDGVLVDVVGGEDAGLDLFDEVALASGIGYE